MKLWNMKDFSCLKTFQGHQGEAVGVDYLTLGTQLITSSSDGQIKLWNIRTSECVSTFNLHGSRKVRISNIILL